MSTIRILALIFLSACTLKVETGEPQITVKCVEFVTGSGNLTRCLDSGVRAPVDAGDEAESGE